MSDEADKEGERPREPHALGYSVEVIEISDGRKLYLYTFEEVSDNYGQVAVADERP